MAFSAKTDKRVCVMMADGCEEIEALTVCDMLWRAGILCDKVSISESLQVTSAHEISFMCDCSICDAEFSFDNYDMIVLPGGMPGTTNLAGCTALTKALIGFANGASEGKYIAAICAAPTVLAGLGLLAGKQATSFPSTQDTLIEAGAQVVADEAVVCDGNFITSQGAGTALEFAYTIIATLIDTKSAQAVARSIVDMRKLSFQGAQA